MGGAADTTSLVLAEPPGTLGAMSNRGSVPDDQPPPLRPMDRDRACHHAEKLRALADLLLAGEPVLWTESSSDSFPAGLETVTIRLASRAFLDACIVVRQRVEAGDEDYAIRVEQRIRQRVPRKAWMGQQRK